MEAISQVEMMFNLGDCTGCDYYDEIKECHGSNCDTYRECGLLRVKAQVDVYVECKQLREQRKRHDQTIPNKT